MMYVDKHSCWGLEGDNRHDAVMAVRTLPRESTADTRAAAAARQASDTQQRRRRGRAHTLNHNGPYSVTHPGLIAGGRRVLSLQGTQHRHRQVHRQNVPHPARLCLINDVQCLQTDSPGQLPSSLRSLCCNATGQEHSS